MIPSSMPSVALPIFVRFSNFVHPTTVLLRCVYIASLLLIALHHRKFVTQLWHCCLWPVTLLGTWYDTYRRRQLSLPPGPPLRPIVGNAWNFEGRHPWVAYAEESKKLNSDIIYFESYRRPILVLNSIPAAKRLLDSKKYSHRPRFVVLNEIFGGDYSTTFLCVGEQWKRHRKLWKDGLKSVDYQASVRKLTRDLLRRLIESPNDFLSHLRLLAGQTVLVVGYGLEIQDSDDPFITGAEKGIMAIVDALTPGKYLVEDIPLLKWMPAWFPSSFGPLGVPRRFKEQAVFVKDMKEKPFYATLWQMEHGRQNVSFVSKMIQKMGVDRVQAVEDIQSVASTMYQAGSDTILCTILFAILGLLRRPDMLKRAQDEIDHLLDGKRLPDFQDRDALPCLEAIVKESLRSYPILPLGIPHYLMEEDQDGPYRIPADTLVLPNIWAMMHDESIYEDPHEFKPERFLTEDGKLNLEIHQPSEVFGFGLRRCPGEAMGEKTLWHTIALLVSVFDIHPVPDEKGNRVPPEVRTGSNILAIPDRFDCVIQPRNDAMRILALQSATSWAELQEELAGGMSTTSFPRK